MPPRIRLRPEQQLSQTRPAGPVPFIQEVANRKALQAGVDRGQFSQAFANRHMGLQTGQGGATINPGVNPGIINPSPGSTPPAGATPPAPIPGPLPPGASPGIPAQPTTPLGLPLPAPTTPQPIDIDTGSLDSAILALQRNLKNSTFVPGGGSAAGVNPDLAAMIQRIQGNLGATEQRISDILANIQGVAGQQFDSGQGFTPQTFNFDDARFGQLRNLIAQIQRGEGVGNIDIEGDPAAAAFRNARERQAQRERSILAEREAASGFNRTGGFDAAVGQQAGSAGRDIAGFEANLANQRRGEVLQQRLAGAQLGLSDLSGERGAALRAFETAQAGRQRAHETQLASRQRAFEERRLSQLGGFRQDLGSAQSAIGNNNSDLLRALQQRQFENTSAQQQASQQRAQARSEFESGLQNQRSLLSGLQGERQNLRQFGLQSASQQNAQANAFFDRQIQALQSQSQLATDQSQRQLIEEQIRQLEQQRNAFTQSQNQPTFQQG